MQAPAAAVAAPVRAFRQHRGCGPALPTPAPSFTAPRLTPISQGAQSRGRGGAFALLNGAAVRDVIVLHVPANVTLTGAVHVLYLSSGGGSAGTAGIAPLSAPRLLAVLEEGASAEVIEEFASLPGTDTSAAASRDGPVAALTSAVAEFELDDRAALKHSYVTLEGGHAAHAKATLVNQVRAAAGRAGGGGRCSSAHSRVALL